MIYKFFNKVWDYIKLAKLELLIITIVIVLDLMTKAIVNSTMELGETKVIIPSFLQFYYTHNYKAAFGSAFGLDKLLGAEGLTIFFLVITAISMVVFAVVMYRFRHKSPVLLVGIALVLGGAFGNFYDRVTLGYVRDFVHIVYFGFDIPLLGSSFAIFNIADMGVTGGVVVLAVYLIFIYKEPQKDNVVVATSQPASSSTQPLSGESSSANEPDNAQNDIIEVEPISVEQGDLLVDSASELKEESVTMKAHDVEEIGTALNEDKKK